MSTEFFNDQWRIPSNENQSKISNYSMQFDGTNEQVNTGNNAPFNAASTNFSISFWCKSPNSFAGTESLIDSRLSNAALDGIAIDFIGNSMSFRQNGGTFTKTLADWGLNNANWNHIVFAYDLTIIGANNVFVYINNSPPPARSLSQTSQPASSGDFKIGDGLRGDFNGSIDQVSVFDYTLSQTQVTNLYGDGTSLITPMALSPAPVAYYQLGDQSVSTGANYLVPNNSLKDYVFETSPSGAKRFNIPSLPIASAATISIWWNPQTLVNGQNATLFGDASLEFLRLKNQGGIVQVIYYDGSGGTLNTNTIVDTTFLNKWHHIALVQNGGAAAVYIDNVNKGAISGGLRTPSFTNIGAMNTGGTGFDGFVSNAATFTTNLPATGTESIASLYNNGSPPDLTSYSGLQRWYKLNAQDTFNGTNWTIKDYAGSSNGTSVNMTSANLVQSDLQHTSGFSPYALNLNSNNANELLLNNTGNAILNGATSFTVSAWINPTDTNIFQNIFSNWGGNILFRFNNAEKLECFISTSTGSPFVQSIAVITYGVWQHVAATYSGNDLKIYRNGVEVKTIAATGTINNATGQDRIGNRPGQTQYFNGGISNVAIWKNSVIDVNTLYNQGVPADLKKLNPSVWWQLGSNSSFNSGLWTCLNEGTLGTTAEPLNATTFQANMTNDQITNGPGYSANGLGTSSIDIIGNAPYSSGNGLSENQDVLDRVKDTPPT